MRPCGSEDAVKNYPYLLINEIEGPDGQPMPSGPVGEVSSPQVAPATAALLELSQTALMGMLGSQEKGEEVRSNVSDEAVALVQERLDMQVYIYMDNFAKAMQRSGEIWLNMARDIYVEDARRMKTIDRQGKVSSVEVGKPMLENGRVVGALDMSRASFDVESTVGPSSATKRTAVVNTLTGMLKFCAGSRDAAGAYLFDHDEH